LIEHFDLNNLNFDIDPSIVFKLGEDLVTDDFQALIELAKNSFDADSKFVNIIIETGQNSYKDSFFKDAQGSIIIEDHGFGMSIETILKSWLIISNSEKLLFKKEGKTTKLGRTPLGDKGLGRLASQRLGNNLEIITFPENKEIGYYLRIKWSDFKNKTKLSDVKIYAEEIPNTGVKGTKLIISELKDLLIWHDQEDLSALVPKLTRLISPFEIDNNFQLNLTVNGEKKDLIGVTKEITDSALIRYNIDFDKHNKAGGLLIKGIFRLKYLISNKIEQKKLYYEFIEIDSGKEFFEYLTKNNSSSYYNIQLSDSEDYFIESSQEKSIRDLDFLADETGEIAYPGFFSGEINYFDLNLSYEDQNIFNDRDKYRNLIKDISGINIYRDGFGVRNDKDWLGLSKQFTSGSSFYGLRVVNTIGYVNISARENIKLEEISSREGFRETPHYKNFFHVMKTFIDYTHEVQTLIRRELNNFLKEKNIKRNEIKDSQDAIDYVKESAKKIKNSKSQFKKINKSMTDAKSKIGRLKANLDKIENEELKKDFEKDLMIIEESTQDVEKSTNELLDDQPDTNKMEDSYNILGYRLENLQEKLIDFYYFASLGLTVEGFTHEIFTIIKNILSNSSDTKSYVTKKLDSDSVIINFLDETSSALSGLRKQISILNPTLKYVRETKSEITLNEYFEKEKSYFKIKSENKTLNLEIINIKNFKIKINLGKFIQIIDNITLNSSYWLTKAIKEKIIPSGIIYVEINSPFIIIYDNGDGISNKVQNSLFEPFITMKPKEKGRGLGLFLVKQFLESDACDIILLNERNRYGNRYKFRLDLRGVLV
jgi:signal transduction histidine kinase